MFTPRRTLLALGLTVMAQGLAMAQDKYPSKPVTVIVPQAAGGANDAIARVIAQKLTEQLGQSFIIDNRTGAGGNVGTVAAARAKPDGYTLMVTADSSMVINPSLYKSTGFDPLKDFESVGTVATAGYVLVANPAFPAKNTADLIALAKQQPGKINIGSAGNGTLNHLIGEMLGKAAGIDLVHIPYKGSSAAVTDLVAGQVQVSVQSLPSSIAFIRSGKVKVLGVVNPKRLPALPDAPTIGETVKGFGTTPGMACSRQRARPNTSCCSSMRRSPRRSNPRTCKSAWRAWVANPTSPALSNLRSWCVTICPAGPRPSRTLAQRLIEEPHHDEHPTIDTGRLERFARDRNGPADRRAFCCQDAGRLWR